MLHRNEVLGEFLKPIRAGLEELISKSPHLPAGTELAYKRRRTHLGVLKQRNPSKARKSMRAHLRAFQRGYRVLFQSNP